MCQRSIISLQALRIAAPAADIRQHEDAEEQLQACIPKIYERESWGQENSWMQPCKSKHISKSWG